jgi:uncharacterized protein UU035
MEKKTELNSAFLAAIQTSFNRFIESKTSRSPAKLKPLHGRIAEDLATKLGEGYKIWSQGYGEDKEKEMAGRYMNKMVDIVIQNAETEEDVAGVGVKFVMQNYSQNSNNYFENMLGETANLRTVGYPYFQVFIILNELPYYKRSKEISRWEEFTDHNAEKYYKLSADNVDAYWHTPNKTLIYVVRVEPSLPKDCEDLDAYCRFYTEQIDNIKVIISPQVYSGFKKDGTVILNDYATFIDKVYHAIMAL